MPTEDTFRVTAKKGSGVFNPLDAHVEDDLLEFIANVQDFSIGVVPADAPKREMPDSYDGNPLSVAQCSRHGFFDVREIRCPECAANAPKKEDEDGKHSS